MTNNNQTVAISSNQTTPEKTVKTKSAAASATISENFPLAAFYFLLSCAFSASQSIFGKVLYRQQPDLTPYQLLAYRAMFSTIINLTMVNIQARKVLWDSIPAGCGKQLFFRIAQQNASIFITFYSIRQFDLTVVDMVNNSATFMIMILGCLVLGERAKLFSFTTLSISFVGTVIVLLGGHSKQSAKVASDATTGGYVLNLVMLVSNPVIIAAGMIAMRKMRKMHESVITTYMNLMLLVIMLCIVYSTGSNLNAWYSFGIIEWVAIAGLACANVGSQTFKFRAIQRSEVGKLQPMTFTKTVFQFTADLLLFDASFETLQFVGIGIVFAMFVTMIVKIYAFPETPEKQEGEEEQQQESQEQQEKQEEQTDSDQSQSTQDDEESQYQSTLDQAQEVIVITIQEPVTESDSQDNDEPWA